MFSAARLRNRALLFPFHTHARTILKMSTSSAMYSSASLKASNAQPFSSMEGKLDSQLLEALKDMKFDFMTPVQSQVLDGLPSLKSDWYV